MSFRHLSATHSVTTIRHAWTVAAVHLAVALMALGCAPEIASLDAIKLTNSGKDHGPLSMELTIADKPTHLLVEYPVDLALTEALEIATEQVVAVIEQLQRESPPSSSRSDTDPSYTVFLTRPSFPPDADLPSVVNDTGDSTTCVPCYDSRLADPHRCVGCWIYD